MMFGNTGDPRRPQSGNARPPQTFTDFTAVRQALQSAGKIATPASVVTPGGDIPQYMGKFSIGAETLRVPMPLFKTRLNRLF